MREAQAAEAAGADAIVAQGMEAPVVGPVGPVGWGGFWEEGQQFGGVYHFWWSIVFCCVVFGWVCTEGQHFDGVCLCVGGFFEEGRMLVEDQHVGGGFDVCLYKFQSFFKEYEYGIQVLSFNS